MGWSFELRLDESVSKERRERLSQAGVTADEYGIVLDGGGLCHDLVDAFLATQGHWDSPERTVVPTEALLPVSRLARAIDNDACPVLSLAVMLGDDEASDVMSDWLDGVVMRRQSSQSMPDRVTARVPGTRHVLDRDATYLHTETVRERMGHDGPEGPSFDVRPTVTSDAMTVTLDVGRSDDVMRETVETSPAARREALQVFHRTLMGAYYAALGGHGLGRGSDPFGRELAEALVTMPTTAVSLVRDLADVHRALATAGIDTIIITQGW